MIKKRQLAICDSDTNYLKMFQAYWQKKNPADFEILIFDTVSQAVNISNEEPFEIFMIGEKIYDSNVINVNASKIFVLQEDGVCKITDYSVAAKYQSMEKLIAQVLDEFAADENCESLNRCGKNKTRLITFYSPGRHKLQNVTSFAAAIALKEMGNKVLYINLLPFTGFEDLLKTNYEMDVTDFMYFVLNHSDKLLYKLDGMKKTVYGVDYLPPALDYIDLMRIGEQDWERAFEAVMYGSDYTHIVADMSETCQGFYKILEKSSSIYILNDNSSDLGQAMNTHFKRLLEAKEYENIFNKLIEFEVPYGFQEKYANFQDILFSPLGTYMKGVIESHE